MNGSRARAGTVRATVVLGTTALFTGCAALGLAREEPEEREDQRLDVAAALAETGSWARSERMLRLLASRCENGEEGRQAMLLLTSLLLDPRNPTAAADSAALMAARFLRLPDAAAPERPMAEALYVLALELGADPGLRPDPLADRLVLAERFSDCGTPVPSDQPLVLPTLERETLAHTVVRLRHQRDSVVAVVPPPSEVDGMRARNRVLEGRVAELETELERIRRLLEGRDTTSLGPRRR